SCIRGYEMELNPRTPAIPHDANEKRAMHLVGEFRQSRRMLVIQSEIGKRMTAFCKLNEGRIKSLLQAIKHDHDSVNELIHLIDELFPHEPKGTPKKRGAIDFIGRLSHSLFGTATDGMVQAVEMNVALIGEAVKGQNSVIKKSIADLTSILTISNE